MDLLTFFMGIPGTTNRTMIMTLFHAKKTCTVHASELIISLILVARVYYYIHTSMPPSKEEMVACNLDNICANP